MLRSGIDRIRGNDFKLKEGGLRLDIREKSFVVRVVWQWNRLPRDVVDTSFLETSKVKQDKALANVI